MNNVDHFNKINKWSFFYFTSFVVLFLYVLVSTSKFSSFLDFGLFNFLMFTIVFVALFTDLAHRKVYNNLIIIGLTLSLIMQIYTKQSDGLLIWLLGLVVGLICTFPFFLVKGMGAGDVKLLGVIGCFVGPKLILITVLATFIFGGLFSIVYVIATNNIKQLIVNLKLLTFPLLLHGTGVNLKPADIREKSVGRMPYVVPIFFGIIYTVFYY